MLRRPAASRLNEATNLAFAAILETRNADEEQFQEAVQLGGVQLGPPVSEQCLVDVSQNPEETNQKVARCIGSELAACL